VSALASRLIQAAWMIPTALFLATWAYQAVRPLVARRRLRTRTHELAPLRPLPRPAVTTGIPEDWTVRPARLAERLEAAHVRCHVCRTRLVVGETAHDAGTGDDGAELFACDEHCTNKECTR